MGCDKPLKAYRSREVGRSGKRGITFSRNSSLTAEPFDVPCGRCIGCRLEHSRQWAMRCMHEKKFHEENSFITLTYDDKHLPEGRTLVRSDPQLFLKRLRFALEPKRFRFFGCGEYGELYGRPHYHMILFGHEFKDKYFYKNTPNGDPLFISPALEKHWGLGFCTVAEVNFKTCAYVARYVTGKITGDPAAAHYGGRCPEFSMMSRDGGIGLKYFKKYGHEVYDNDSVVVNGKTVRPPRYYDVKFEAVDSKKLVRLKKVRRRKALANKSDNTSARRYVKTEVLRLNLLKREFK